MRLEAFDSVPHVTRAIADRGERVVRHSLQHLFDGQDAGGMALLLLWRSASRDPLGDQPLFRIVNPKLARSDSSVSLGACA